MKISLLKQCILLCREAGTTPFVWGHRGLGKSSAFRQLCAENHLGFIDYRCSQLEASELRGLPDKDMELKRTVYLPPAELPSGVMTWEAYEKELEATPPELRHQKSVKMQPLLKEGILFLDELPRAQDDVLQAAFQLVLDGAVGLYTLPPGWSVGVASNFLEGGYVLNGFTDAAFLDRFCHLTLSGGDSSLDEWVGYMTDQHGEHASSVIEFATQNLKHLDGEIEGQLGFNIQPSRRSWEFVVKVQRCFAASSKQFSQEALLQVVSGLVGPELAVAYLNYSCPVKPRDVLTRGMKTVASELAKLTRGQLIGLMWGMISFVKDKVNEDKTAETTCDFASWLCSNGPDKDLAIAFCRSLLTDGKNTAVDQVRVQAMTNQKVAELLKRVSKDQPKKNKTFLDRLHERKDLAALLERTVWGRTSFS
jgi:hypothetical protein